MTMDYQTMFKDYIRTPMTWKQVTGEDRHNQKTYAAPQNITCRKLTNTRMVRDQYGETVQSTGELWTFANVQPDDIINDGTRDWRVINVASNVDLDGNVTFLRVFF